MTRHLLVVALFASQAAQALSLGAPHEPAVPPRAPARGVQSHLAVATSSAGTLAAWEDARNRAKPAIRVSRLDATAKPMHGGGVEIGADGGKFPAVASAGAFVVAWASSALDHVYARRLADDGSVLGDVLDLGAGRNARPAITTDGTNTLVAFASDADHLSFRLIPNTGAPGAASTIDARGIDGAPAVVFDGSQFFAAWHASGGVFATTITRTGAAKPGFLVAANGSDSPGLLRNGATTLVAWREARTNGDHLWAQLFKNALPYGESFVVGTAIAQAGSPVVMADGSDFLIAWPEAGAQGTQDFYAAHADATAAVIDTAIPLLVGRNAREVAGVAVSGRTFVGWSAADDLFAAPLLADTTVDASNAVPLATTAAWREGLQLAFGESRGVATWVERTDATDADVKAALVDAAGTFGAGIALDVAEGAQDLSRAAVMQGGFAVAWRDRRVAGKAQIRLARHAAGVTAEPAGLVLNASDVTEAGAPSLAAATGTVYVAWREKALNRSAIVVATAPEAGAPTDGAHTLANAASNETLGEAHVVALGAGALVVWTSTIGTQTAVQVQRVDSRGAAQGAVRTISTTTALAGELDVTVGGNEAVVTWAVAGAGVVAWPLGADGAPKSSTPWLAAGGAGMRRDARIAFDGRSFVIAWREDAGAFVSRFAPDGQARNSMEPMSLDAWPVSLASAGAETTLFAYDVLDGSPAFDTRRLYTRALAFPPRALSQSATVGEDTALDLTLTATDLREPASAIFRVDVPPEHGTLRGTAPNVTYMPAPDYSGEDTFSFVVDDAGQTSEPASVRVTVLAVNDAPRVKNQSARGIINGGVLISLDALDPDGDAMTYRLLQRPGHGLLEGAAPSFKYTPESGFCGVDRLVWVAADSQGAESEQATVTIQIWPEGGGPCPAQHATEQGCSCGTSPAALALLALLVRRRRR